MAGTARSVQSKVATTPPRRHARHGLVASVLGCAGDGDSTAATTAGQVQYVESLDVFVFLDFDRPAKAFCLE